MTWLAWRQLRFPAAVIAGAAAALAAALLAAGVPDATLELFAADQAQIRAYSVATVAMMLLPAMIGMFWGAPLVARELEAGTHRLVWNQSVTRTRWLATRLALTGGAAAVVCGALGLLLTWWADPIMSAQRAGQEAQGIAGVSRMDPQLFIAHGIVPAGYAVFAFALGVAAGTLIRRTVPAMAVTAAVFALVQFAVPPLVREHLGPTTRSVTVTPDNFRGLLMDGPDGSVVDLHIRTLEPGAWMITNELRGPKGETAIPDFVAGCVRPDLERKAPIADAACFQRLADLGWRQHVVFQPASRYWTLQALELVGFLALSGVLFAFTFFWVRRRV